MIFVTGRSKRAIEDHFDTAYELESELEAAGKQELLAWCASVQPDDMDCRLLCASQQPGPGPCRSAPRALVGDEPFAVLLADDLMVGKPGGTPVLAHNGPGLPSSRPLSAGRAGGAGKVRRYGIVAGEPAGGPLLRVQRIVENPRRSKPRRAWGGWPPSSRHHLRPNPQIQPKGAGGEIQLTDAIARPDGARGRVRLPVRGRYDLRAARRAFRKPPWSWRCSTRRWGIVPGIPEDVEPLIMPARPPADHAIAPHGPWMAPELFATRVMPTHLASVLPQLGIAGQLLATHGFEFVRLAPGQRQSPGWNAAPAGPGSALSCPTCAKLWLFAQQPGSLFHCPVSGPVRH